MLRSVTKICQIIVLTLCLGPTLWSLPWYVAQGTLDPVVLNKLKTKYPELISALDVQNFLRDLSALTPLAEATFEITDNKYALHIAPAKQLKSAEFRLVNRSFRSEIENLVQQYIGSTDSEDLRTRVVEILTKYLRDRGYPVATIQLKIHNKDGGVEYRFRIDYGAPCLIESVLVDMRVPSQVGFNVEPGDVCDTKGIEEAIAQFEKDVKEEGYNQLRVDKYQLIYDSKRNSARLIVPGDLGSRVRYEIQDKTAGLTLSDLFSADEIANLDPTLMTPESMAVEIRQRYQSRGFDDAQIEGPDSVRSSHNTEVLRYKVEAGPRYTLENVQIQGAREFSRDQIMSMLNLSSFFEEATYLRVDAMNRGIETIRQKYREKGFWDIEVREPRITKNRDTAKAQAFIVIEEGIQRKLAGVEIRANQAFGSEELQDLAELKTGEPFDQSRVLDLEQKIREHYIRGGYIYADISTKIEQRPAINVVFVTIVLSIDEGQRVKIGDIQIRGLVNTWEKVVTRELQFKTGDWYDPDTIDASRRALTSLGIFQSVLIVPADRNSAIERNPNLDMIVEVKEAQPGSVSFGPGWSLFRGNRFTGESAYSNIGGVGRQIYGRAQISEDANQESIGSKTLIGHTVSVGYVEPYIFDWPFNGVASASNSARADDKWQLSTTGEVALVHKFRGFLTGSTGSVFFREKIDREVSRLDDREGYLRLLGGNVQSGRVGVRYNWDHRDNPTFPTSGFILGVEYSRADMYLGGTLAFQAWQANYSHYFAINDRTVIAVGFALESFFQVRRRGNEADALPQTEALHMGGADTVRGFRERSLGPLIAYDVVDENGNVTARSSDTVLGGSQSSVFKLELRRKIFIENVAVTSFVDTGNVYFLKREIQDFNRREALQVAGTNKTPAAVNDNSDYELSDLFTRPEYIWTRNYAAYGIAANYLSPLGSINLAYGIPWKRCSRETPTCVARGATGKHPLLSGQVHINVGTNF